MPSIAQSVQNNEDLTNAGKLSPVPETTGIISQTPILLPNAVNGLPLRGAFPVNFTLDTDFQNNTQTTRTGPSMRGPLFPIRSSNIVSIEQVKTIVKNVVNTSASSITTIINNPPNSISTGGSTGSGTTLQVNGTTLVQPIADISSTLPSPPAGTTNVLFTSDTLNPTNISASMPLMVGDSGSGGKSGAVPAPPSGSFAAGEFLNAGGTYSIPPGTGGAAFYQTVQNNGISKPPENKLNFLGPLVATDVPGVSTNISISPSVTLYATQALTGDVSMVANTSRSIDSINITMPSVGGPWRVFFSYAYYWMSTHTPDSQFWATDGTQIFGGVSTGAGSNPAAASGATWAGFTPITYANGAAITLTVMAEFDTSATVTRLSQFSQIPASHLEYSVFSSN